jgi:hypothetical protein
MEHMPHPNPCRQGWRRYERRSRVVAPATRWRMVASRTLALGQYPTQPRLATKDRG